MKKTTKHILAMIIFIAIDFAIVFGLYYVGVLAFKLGFPDESITDVIGKKAGTFTTGFILLSILFAIIGCALGLWKLFMEIYIWISINLEKK